MGKLGGADAMPDAIGDRAGFSDSCLRQENAKLLAAVTRRDVGRTQATFQAMRRDLEREITRLVTVFVVVSFEVIDVDHQKAHRKVVTSRTVQLFRESLFEIAAVRQRGERIGDRHELKLG